VKTVNGEVQLHTLVDGKKIIINESTVRRDLQLEDAEGIDYLPNSTIFEQLALIGAKTTAWNKFSSTMASAMIYKDIHKELGDSLVRDATTTSSLEVEQDSGNITKTRSKATLNEPSTPGTSSGSGPMRQETIGDTIAQTRFENISKLSNDPLLARDNEIASFKRRAKKLEKKDRSRTHKLKRLYKIGLSARVESFGDEEDLGEDASKQGRRIHDIDADEDITLVNDDNEIFNVDALASEEVFVAEQSGNVVEEIAVVIDAANSIPVSTTTITDVEITLVKHWQTEEEERPAREKTQQIEEPNIVLDDVQVKVEPDYQLAQRLQAQEQEELTHEEKARLFVQFIEQRRKHFAAKRAKEKRNKPPTRAQQRNIMTELVEESSKKAKTELEENLKKAEAEVMTGSSKKAREEMEQESIKKQKVDKDKEIAELQGLIEIIPDEVEVIIDAIPLAVKSPRIRVFSQMLKSFDRDDLEDLYKLIKAKYGSTRLVEDMDYLLWNDMKIMFELHVEDEIWKMQQGYKVLEWKLYDSCGVHSLRMQSMHIYMLVEKQYPLTPSTVTNMLNNKLQVDYLNEMAYQLLKLLTK
ncbi:hypothetical protein Tco_0825561, partial [Tanacetum coccineum]